MNQHTPKVKRHIREKHCGNCIHWSNPNHHLGAFGDCDLHQVDYGVIGGKLRYGHMCIAHFMTCAEWEGQ